MSVDPCIFCQIAHKQRPAQLLQEDDRCVVFADINPQAPTHLLAVPKRHVAQLGDLTPADEALVGHLVITLTALARKAGIAGSGYRVVVNCGPDGGQTVPHLHAHLLGGRVMKWPPG